MQSGPEKHESTLAARKPFQHIIIARNSLLGQVSILPEIR